MERICFVVMGFGKKTDYSGTPRTLDLDASYESIIKPAVVRAGLKCIRADEVSHSGLIDVKMFELLLGADVVVADISTANPNALYELGVRHALRPYTTILVKEVDGKFHFDLNHLATLQYKHLGEDIGAKEAAAKSAQLEALIRSVLAKAEPDSPVYTFLAGLKAPTLGAARAVGAAPAQAVPAESYAVEVEAGKVAALRSDHAAAWAHFARARALQPGVVNAFVTQQLALHRYKSRQPDTVTALAEARKVIEELQPATSTDPETLSIAGAIEKRLWEARKDRAHLEAAIELYGRGFHLKQDYYNGENYALCLDARAAVQEDPAERDYDARTARKVRQRIVATLEPLLREDAPGDRPKDHMWMLATMAGTHFSLGLDGGAAYEKRFRELHPPDWAIETFEKAKRAAQGGK